MKNNRIYILIVVIASGVFLWSWNNNRNNIQKLKNDNTQLKFKNTNLLKNISNLVEDNNILSLKITEKQRQIVDSEKKEKILRGLITDLKTKYKYEKSNPIDSTISDKLKYIRTELLH